MLDVHPPEHAAHTWRDFFIHIATIVIGLLIAIGLEQTVEFFHHRYERTELTERMRTEAEANLPIIHESLARLRTQLTYVKSIRDALRQGKLSGSMVEVTGLTPPGGSTVFISPSRGTWSTAESAGLVVLLPTDQAKLYARIDFGALEEVDAENAMIASMESFAAESLRAGYDHTSPLPQSITAVHRDDLLASIGHVEFCIEALIIRLSLTSGGDQAIAAGKLSLDELYPYQQDALSRIDFQTAVGSFYGSQPSMVYKITGSIAVTNPRH